MLNKKKSVQIIGSGFSGLSAACYAAKNGHTVNVFEKNEHIGGRARVFSSNGFTFDMGPSWYWMPDVFDNFFGDFNKKVSDYYDLVKLDPGFQMIFSEADTIQVPANLNELYSLFEGIEKGSADQLKKFLKEAEFKYKVGMNKLVFQPCLSWGEFINAEILAGVSKTHIFRSFSKYVRSFFKDPRLITLMEFPVLFLGAKPENTPALYSLMNYAELSQGTYYPMGGMFKITEAMHSLAKELGVNFIMNSPIKKIQVKNKQAYSLKTEHMNFEVDQLIASSDYHHTETLLDPEHRNYTEKYWDKKTFAPSSLIFYIGVNKKLPKLLHHNLFFDKDFNTHAVDIYDQPAWPKEPLFYACCPSKTDKSVAPEGCENLFLLIPIAPDLDDKEELRSKYFDSLISRLEKYCGVSFKENIVYSRSYCVRDFKSDYNAYKGNAYGLANTLRQTAVLKPSIINKKVHNMIYTGQLTVPGPGVPPSIISGKIAANLLKN